MSEYEAYIKRLCRTGQYTPEQARKMALSREVEKYYQKSVEQITIDKSTYMPTGECR